MNNPRSNRSQRSVICALCLFALIAVARAPASAHPLGNFTVNHFTRLEVSATSVRVHYVVDMAEIPALQELQTIDRDGNGAPTQAELDLYAARNAREYADGLMLTVDETRLPLTLMAERISLPAGAGNLPTLRLECDYEAALLVSASGAWQMRFADANHQDRIGWREIVVTPVAGVQVFNSTAFGGASLSDELRAYPTDRLTAPLDERAARFSVTTSALPANARPLLTRDGHKVEPPARDRLAELISVKELTIGVALVGLLLAAVLGSFHAMSPGHGKTIVAAYLVGARGTAKHAVFLGLTVTITHTAGVFALGLITLFAAQYVVPERLYPILSVISGAIVVIIGLSLFIKRLNAALGFVAHEHEHESAHTHSHDHEHMHAHEHTHDGHMHTHLPPGADGRRVTWRSLLALGISGGLLPCPSALVVLLGAISAQRVGYGLVLVIAFSFGLATTLTVVGLLFVYARRLVERPMQQASALVRVLPVVSALVITGAGLFICYEAIGQAGYNVSGLLAATFTQTRALFAAKEPELATASALTALTIGLVFGLKHATEVDHVVAVTNIVSEQRKLWRAALVGALWGTGHTATLVVVGIVVLVLRVAIPDRVGAWLEFGVALMIILLGTNTFVRALRNRGSVHVHKHRHGGLTHAHVHFHDEDTLHEGATVAPHSHTIKRIGIKPLLVGAMHGLAGSAVLTLLVLAQIGSPVIGLLYLLVFGFGSIVGILLMSGLVGLPFILTARKLDRFHHTLQTIAGALSICFGLWYAYVTGIASGLLIKG
jgi:nickel/cobalt transporter (NicO) family protein